MSPEVRQLFADIAALPPDERVRELDRRSPDAAVRREVELLLTADALTDSRIEGPIRRAATDLAATSVPLRLGAWRTVSLLGQGGLGFVYKAERCDGTVEQTAAIKLLYRGLETQELLNRFQRERSILARLSHGRAVLCMELGDAACAIASADRSLTVIRA